MKYFSMFTGVGGFEFGIKQAYESNTEHAHKCEKPKQEECTQGRIGAVNQFPVQLLPGSEPAPLCVGFSEIDKYCNQLLSVKFPGIKNYGDATKINPNELPDFDLLVGGFPCQSFSIAGKRRGFDDTRGTLFFDIARILREKKPRLFVLENVKGLLSHDNGNTFKTIISTLVELGYDIQWQVLNSKNHGVPQNRERVFIIGHTRGTPRPEVFPFGENANPLTTKGGKQPSDAVVSRTLTATDAKMHLDGNYINQINNPTHSNNRLYGTDGISPTLNTAQGGNRQPKIRIQEATKKGYAEATVGQSINLSVPNSKTRRGRVSDVAQTLDTGMQQHTLMPDARIRRLTPLECERLQGFPDGHTLGFSDAQRYKMCGNAVTVNVVEAIIKKLLCSGQ